ncbi:protein transport protein Sec24D [Nephila pilipes]|uniref:Protein transport protein Sec24D n=1 Tax=Nephila pilipes TaxID=299642 RepID=A0A8X6I2S0_NEPPI|nr:protein transport protein Sec24D [Nephila pilipes]
MIPPPSHLPPGGNQMYDPQSANKLSYQMQDMKLGPPLPQTALGKPPPSNPQMMPGASSPQHRPTMPTTVTYSTQPRATYPYVNNNPPGSVNPGTPVSPMNNNQYPPPPNVPYPNQSSTPQQTQKHQISSPILAPPSNNAMYSNGISNGHEDNKLNQNIQSLGHSPSQQNYNGPQSPLSVPPQGQMPYQHPPKGPHAGPPNSPYPPQQFSSPNSMHGQPMSPPQPVFQQYSQSPPSSFPPPMGSIPGGLPPGSPQFSNMPPNQAPPGSPPWQNSQFQGAGAQNAPGYPYGTPTQGIQQQPRKLDLDMMPSTVQYREEDKNARSGYYTTDAKGQLPPLVTTDFIVQDRGMCSPRFIRSSLYCLPTNPDVLKQTAIPLAITINPLASLQEGEAEPPSCLYREQGPLRCKRCKAYICPFMTFIEGGRCFQCAFCKVVTEVPQDYFCFLDGMGERTDKYHRPELCLGSYEYIATKEYCRNDELPNPPAYIFMIEVSNATFRNGLIPLLCENMKHVLHSLINDEKNDTSKLRVGFVTYNNVLHFYNMKKNLTQPHIMVLSDVHNAFVPLLEGFLVTLAEAEALVDSLMEHIPRIFMNEPATEIILGPVIQVGLEALKNANCSGKLLIFHSTIPNADAPGKLPHREGQKLLGTDKQKIALAPQTEFYSKLAQDCVAAGCAVDLFLFPSTYVDIASMSPLCRHTGGQIYKYTYFQSHIDGDRFLEDLERNITTPTAFDAVLRVRTSAGISPNFYYGNFYMSNTTDIELSAIDCHKAVTVEFKYDDKLSENETMHIQAALLYTTRTGERRIRVHNLAFPTTVAMPDVYKCCEMDTTVNFFAKQALKQLLDQNPQQIKNNLISRSAKILSCYRKNCAMSSSTVQLVLPDTLKLLPLYVSCILKSDAISGGPDISLDDRSFAMLAVNSMDVKSTATYFYPTLIPLHDVDPDSTSIPNPIRCSIEKLSDSGAYLLENGIYMFLWIGQAINPDWLQNVLGVQSTNQIDKQKTSLPELNTPLSNRIRQIIEDIEEGRQWFMRLSIMVQGDKLEIVFRQFLVEDRGADGSPSYADFLCHLHREISKNQ